MHGSSYRSVPMYRPDIDTIRINVSTHYTVGHINKMTCTTHTDPLSDQYILFVPSDTSWYDEPCFHA